jgi:hypothetical protein
MKIENIHLRFKVITKYVVPKSFKVIFGFVRRKVDHYVYSKEEGGCFRYVALYVDNMLLLGNNMDARKEVKM